VEAADPLIAFGKEATDRAVAIEGRLVDPLAVHVEPDLAGLQIGGLG